jgi:hypothetical protein
MEVIDASQKVVVASVQGWPYGTKISGDSILAGNYDIVPTHDGDSHESFPGYEKKTIRLSCWMDGAATVMEPGWPKYYVTRGGRIGRLNTDMFTRIFS